MSAQYDRLQRILKYFQQLATFVRKANEIRTALARLDSESQLMPMDGDTTHRVNQQRLAMTQVLSAAETKAIELAKRATFEDAEQLVQELEARLGSAEEIQQGIRAYEAQLELAATLDSFESLDERRQAEAKLDALRDRYRTQLELADAKVPVTSSILELAR